MFPFLSALSGIAGSIGLPALANGLNAVGGMAGGSMPFGMTTPGTAANGGWSTTTTPSAALNPMTNLTGAQAGQQQSPIPQTQAPEIPVAAPQQGPVDISQLLSILQNRSRLGA
jgi:hypothetical protein